MKLSEAEDTVNYQNKKIGEMTQILEENNVDTGQFFHNLKEQRDIEKRKTNRLADMTKEYNKLSEDMQKCLAQNALLRQIAKVPDNFGENMDDIKMQTEGNINNYKRKIKFLEMELEQAEAGRAEFQLKLRKMMGTLYSNEHDKRYANLSFDQLQKVDEYAYNLQNGIYEYPVTDKTKELQKENERLKAQLEVLENNNELPIEQLIQHLQNNMNQGRGSMHGSVDNDVLNKEDLMDILREHREEMQNIVNNNIGDKMAQTLGLNLSNKKPVGSNDPSQSGLGTGRRLHFPGKYFESPKPIDGLFGDMVDSKTGFSEKFQTKFKVDSLDQDYSGDLDLKTAKTYITALQLQNLENMELIDRKEKEIEDCYLELEDLKSSMKKGLLLQDELFVRHHQKLLDFDTDTKGLKDMNMDLETTNQELTRKIELFEKSLNAFKSADKNRIEAQLVEATKRGAIAETNVIKLSRKYASLDEEHKDLLEKWRSANVNFSERETQLLTSLEHLLSWKEEATEKLKIMLERGRQGVSLEDHRAVKTELELMQEKYANLRVKEAEMIANLSKNQSNERELNALQENIRSLDDDLSSAEIEIEVLQLRLNQVDPIYRKFDIIFKNLANTMKQKNISPLQVFELYDKNKDRSLQASEMILAFQSMGIVTNASEYEVLFMFLDLDGSGSIDYEEFIKKLRRAGVANRSKEEEIINRLWSSITKSNLTLEQAFRVFDKDNDNLITYDDMVNAMNSLSIAVDPKTISELFRMADVTGDGKISSSEFVFIFKKYNKISYERSEDTHLDWKFDVMAKLDKVATEKDFSIEDIFNTLDTDSDGKIGISEMNELFKSLGTRLDDKEFEKLFYAIDDNRSGYITYTEFLAYINRAKKEADRVSRAKIIQTKQKQHGSDYSLQNIDSDPNADASSRYQLKVSLLEAKEKSANRQLQKLALKLEQMEEQLSKEEHVVRSLEDANVRTKKEYFDEKQKRSKLESRYQSGVTKEKAQQLVSENQGLRVKVSQLTGALHTFRTLHEAAVNEAKNLKLSIARDKDEVTQLRNAVIDLQSESDEKALIGKLYKKNLNIKWSEANGNQRYDVVLDNIRKLKIENSDLSMKIKNKDVELFDIQSVFTEKLMLVEGQLKEARMSILPTLSLSRIEDLNLQVKRLAESKLELEINNKKLREQSYEQNVRIDNYLLREKSVTELEIMLKEQHPDELSQRVIDITSKLSDYRLKELKAQREVYLVKEREEYYARVNRTQVDHIKKLEEEISKYDIKYNEREEFWRKRHNDQLKLFYKQSGKGDLDAVVVDKSGKLINKGQYDGVEANYGLIDDSKVLKQLNKGMAKDLSSRKELGEVQKDISQSALNRGMSRENLEELKERVHILTQENQQKEQRIERLKDELKTKQVDVNYQTKNLDQITFGKLEAETKQMANAAQQTIQTLQAMLDEKNEEIEQKDVKIGKLQREKLANVKELRKMQLENEANRREHANSEAGRINMEHMSSVRLLQKLGQMDHKEMEKMVMGYENKIRILSEEMAECERSNAELVTKLRNERLEKNKIENRTIKDTNLDNMTDVKKEIHTLKEMNKKKNSELIKLKKLIEELKKDLFARDEDLVKQEKSASEKIGLTLGQTGEVEMKLSALTKRFGEVNLKFKEANNQLKSLKLGEVKHREEISELKEENTKLKTFNAKIRDDNIKLKKKLNGGLTEDDQNDASLPKIPEKRRGSMSKQSPIPPSPSSKPKSQKLQDRDELKIQNLEAKIIELEKINTELNSLVKADFIDEEDKTLIPTEASAFRDLKEMASTIKKYLNLNKSIRIYPLMKQCDTRDLGLVQGEEMLKQFASVGIKFSKYDQTNLLKWAPQDKLGNVKYQELYDVIMGLNNQNVGTVYSAGELFAEPKGEISTGAVRTEKKYGMVASREERKPVPPKKSEMSEPLDLDNDMTMLQQTRNVNLLKKRLDEKQNEIKRLQTQLTSWRDKCQKAEMELQEKQNKKRLFQIPVSSSEIDPKLPNQTTAFKMIKELEDQVSEAHRQMNFEVEKRDSDMNQLTETIKNLINENKLISSENDTMRSQLEKIFTQRLTPNQISEEKDKQRELLLSSLMAKLEKSRTREQTLNEKVSILEKENIDLKYIKEGIDTRIESLNRKNRELESKKKPYQ